MIVGVAIVTLMIGAQTQPPPPTILIYDSTGRVIGNAHLVTGTIVVPPRGPNTPDFFDTPVILTESAAFKNADSYKCFVSQLVGGSPATGGTVHRTDGSHFTVRVGTAPNVSWQQDYLCIGN